MELQSCSSPRRDSSIAVDLESAVEEFIDNIVTVSGGFSVPLVQTRGETADSSSTRVTVHKKEWKYHDVTPSNSKVGA